MQGINTFEFNGSTMQEIVQLWVDKNIVPKVKVTKVKQASNMAETFEITIEDVIEEPS